ncbi:mersacidin family lantibiotic [Priestia megaterium]|uniref:mersacidin family lantibiotic n=2 Tax=Priestia megaterium TaxID=1404 RepID=UPI001C212B90|nr:mersacidin family lantibiotic [Priestia megaterium]MBU8589136.1 mersacidin family lantibiotic [Priestia megaterium]MBU8589137.1 mersacidin family lantibiotic [Priestia megaterium]
MSRNQVMEELKMNHPAGAPMVEVSEDELTRVYGGGDVQPETTPGVTALTIITLYVPSKLNC